jgi:hypothetical protein
MALVEQVVVDIRVDTVEEGGKDVLVVVVTYNFAPTVACTGTRCWRRSSPSSPVNSAPR